MNKTIIKLALVSTFSLALPFSALAAQFISIGTGGVTGVYYPTGGAVCRLVNKIKKETGIRCLVESTEGSVYNIEAIRNGELDFGMAQSDVIFYAIHGKKKFEGNSYPKLRSVMGIYPELLALVVNKEAKIRSIRDLKGKRVNVDIAGSGTRLTTELVLGAEGLKIGDLAHVGELAATKAPNLLKNKTIDGYFAMFGHPTEHIKDTANSIRADLVPIEGSGIDALIEKYPYYTKGIISGTLYKRITHDTPSIGVKSVLVTSDKMDDTSVYTVVKAVLDNFDEFKKLHPAYKTITKESLLEGAVAPLHLGAKKYYKEIGILK